jgi:hypothetical protein
MVTLRINQRRQTIVNGDVVYKDVYRNINAVLQPMKTEDLLVKPEASRNFAWYWLHIKKTEPRLYVNQQFFIKNKPYKILGVKDWSLNGYVEYECIEDFQ